LSGRVNTKYAVDIYDIDLFDSSKELILSLKEQNRVVICYFSAGSYENWREDRKRFPPSILGKSLDGWRGERWLDIRSDIVKKIMKKRLDLALQKGCDGVEPDNVDGYLNDTGFKLSYKEQLKYSKFLAKEAHKRGLDIALKNSLDQAKKLEPYFDFLINEQCFEYNECYKLKPFIEANKPVLNVEYRKKLRKNRKLREKICKDSIKSNFKTLILPLNLDDSFRFSCD